MKCFHLFLFAVLVGVAFGKRLECLEGQLIVCSAIANQGGIDPGDQTKQCEKVQNLVTCLEAAAKACPNDAPKTMSGLISLLKDLCNVNSQLYKDIKTYGPCLNKEEVQGKVKDTCVAGFVEEFKNIGQPDPNNIQAYVDKVMDLICNKRETAVNCMYGQIKSECGEGAEKFARSLIGPFDELFQETCNGVSISSISMGAMVLLQLLVAIFSFRRIL